MTRHGEPIEDLALRDAVETGIQYGMAFEGIRACVWAGLDLERWEVNRYDSSFMARVVAAYRLDGMIEQHSRQAQAAAAKKKGPRR